jgi:uncharacterized membrane protein (UPF0127 family)
VPVSCFGVLAVAAVVSFGLLRGCDEKTSADVAAVKIAGKPFHLEIAATDAVRFLGLGKRTHIEDDGGMIFVFTNAEKRDFVMRDCPIPIDILYLDGSGRVLTTYTMTPEAPRGADEAEGTPGGDAYNAKLKRYPSRFATQLVVELQGGMIPKLGVKEGDLVQLKAEELKKLAK